MRGRGRGRRDAHTPAASDMSKQRRMGPTSPRSTKPHVITGISLTGISLTGTSLSGIIWAHLASDWVGKGTHWSASYWQLKMMRLETKSIRYLKMGGLLRSSPEPRYSSMQTARKEATKRLANACTRVHNCDPHGPLVVVDFHLRPVLNLIVPAASKKKRRGSERNKQRAGAKTSRRDTAAQRVRQEPMTVAITTAWLNNKPITACELAVLPPRLETLEETYDNMMWSLYTV